MNDPLYWNSLSDAAAWLSEATGSHWTAREVLNAPLMIVNPHYAGYNEAYFRKVNPHKPSPTFLKAAMPVDTSFALYEHVPKKGLVLKHEVAWGTLPLHPPRVAQLLATGKTTMASGPPQHEDLEAFQFVLIEPIDQQHIVTLDMVGITGSDLKLLERALAWLEDQKKVYADPSPGEKKQEPEQEPTVEEEITPGVRRTAEIEQEISDLFDTVHADGLAQMFKVIANEEQNLDQWRNWIGRAARNRLRQARMANRGKGFNPVKVADWLVTEGKMDRARVNRILVNNLPLRSRDKKYLITGEIE